MNEKELGVLVDSAFKNLGYEIKNEVKYPHVRIDKEATNGDLCLLMELEGTTRYNSGVRQLQQLREVLKFSRHSSPKDKQRARLIRKNTFVLVVPEITNAMSDITSLFHIQVLDTKSLDKLRTYNLRQDEVISSQGNDFLHFIDHVLDTMKKVGNDENMERQIFCDISDGSDKLIRIVANGSKFNFLGYHGIESSFYFKGKRMKTDPIWEAMRNRINEKNSFEEQKVKFENSYITFEDYFYNLDEEQARRIWNPRDKLVNLSYWVFNDYSNLTFTAKIFESTNPFAILYGKEYWRYM